jgi:hypothetical protein
MKAASLSKVSKLLAPASGAGVAALEDESTSKLKNVHPNASKRYQRSPTCGAALRVTEMCPTGARELAAGVDKSCNEDLQR